MERENVLEAIIDSFEQMWGNHPTPTLLLNKEHDILAVNKAAQILGITPGIKCHSLNGNDRMCQGCKAPVALKKGVGMRDVVYNESANMLMDSYWIPVGGSDGYYIHFGNDITAFAKPELISEKTSKQIPA